MWEQNNDAEIPKDYQKLRQQNIKLRNELKQINEFLTKQVEKKQDNQNFHRSSVQVNTELKDETLKAELQNAQKQIKIQLKQISILQNRQEIVSLDKYGSIQLPSIAQLQSQLKKNGEQIKELEQEKRLLTNINGKYEKKLIELTEDDIIKHRMEQLEQENYNLKQKIQAYCKTERSQSVQVAKVDHVLKPIQLSQKQQEIMKEKDIVIQQLQQKLQEQEKHIKILNSLKGQYDKQLGAMSHRIKYLEQQLGLMNQLLQEKNAEIHKRNHLLPNLSMRNAKYQQQKINLSLDHGLADIEKTSLQHASYQKGQNTLLLAQHQMQTQHSQQHTSQTQRSRSEKSKEIQIKRVESVGTENDQAKFFDPLVYHRLHNLKIWWYQEFLTGISAYYMNSTKIVTGNIHSEEQLEKCSPQMVELNQSDFIKSIGFGFQDNKINFVQMVTQQNCVLKFGTESKQLKLLDISDGEVFGNIQGSFNNNYISSIGFAIFDSKLVDQIR